jgi:hypothetical protein
MDEPKLVVDHGPWSRLKVQTAEVANYGTSGAAARAAGATVTPTAPQAGARTRGPRTEARSAARPCFAAGFILRD